MSHSSLSLPGRISLLRLPSGVGTLLNRISEIDCRLPKADKIGKPFNERVIMLFMEDK